MVSRPTYPQQLLPPQKPPTVSEMREMRSPPTAAITPEQRAQMEQYNLQLEEHQKSISKVQEEIVKQEQNLQKTISAYESYTQQKSYSFTTVYLSHKRGIEQQVRTLKDMLNKLQQGFLISSREAISYAAAAGETIQRQTIREGQWQERTIAYKEAQKLQEAPTIVQQQYQVYLDQGFTESDATILAQQQMSFTKEGGKEFLRQQVTTPTTQPSVTFGEPHLFSQPSITKLEPEFKGSFISSVGMLGGGVFIEDLGIGGTARMRPPLPEEQFQMEQAAYPGTWKGIVERGFEVAEDVGAITIFGDVAPYVEKGIRETASIFQTYAGETPLAPVGDKINLPITNKGIDIVKAIGDILNAYEMTKKGEITARNSIQQRADYLGTKVEELKQVETEVERNNIIKQIKNRGIKVEEVTIETGEQAYKFEIPIPRNLKDKLNAETFAAFFTTASGIGFGKSFGEITGLLYTGKSEREKALDIKASEKVFGTIGELFPYTAGSFGVGLLVEPFVEKGVFEGKEELQRYIVEHPIETLILGGVAIGGAVGAVKKFKRARRFKSYQQAKVELDRLTKYYETISPKPISRTPVVSARYTGKLKNIHIQQMRNLQVDKEIINRAIKIQLSGSYDVFQKTVPTMEKTAKGFYNVKEFGRTVKFYNNKITITLFLDDGTTRTFTLLSRSNRPLTNFESFFKYGVDKRIVAGVSADEFTLISMGKLRAGEVKDVEKFIAKKTGKKIDIRKTRGIEKFTDDLKETFEVSTPIGETTITKPIDTVDDVFGSGRVKLRGEKAEVTLFAGTQRTTFQFQKTVPKREIGDPFLSKLIREQRKGRELLFKPRPSPSPFRYDFTDTFFDDLTPKSKPKPKPSPKGSQETIFFPSQKVIETQEVATRVFSVTDIKPKAPPFSSGRFGGLDVSGRFEGLELGGVTGGLGTLTSGRLDIIEADKTSMIEQLKIRPEVIEVEKVEPSVIEGTVLSPLIKPEVREGLGIAPALTSKLGTKAKLKQEQVQDTFTSGITSEGTFGDFTFPGEKIKFRIPFDLDREKKFRKATRTGYHAFAKSKGRYKKVTTKPMTREGAKDVGSRIVDHTTSAMFKIEGIKQTKVVKGKQQLILKRFEEQELGKGDNYFKSAAVKFRDFMIRRGNKLQMKDKWIEKKRHRADTRGEQQGLTVAQFKSREFKRRKGLPVRRTKKRPKGRVGKYFGI